MRPSRPTPPPHPRPTCGRPSAAPPRAARRRAALGWAVLTCVVLAGCGRGEDLVRIDRGDARASLYRIEPAAGTPHAERVAAWQVVVVEGIDPRHPAIGEAGPGIDCDGPARAACDAHAAARAATRGATVIAGLGRLGLDPPPKPGPPRVAAFGAGGFESALGGSVPPSAREPVRGTVALVARCPVRVDRVSGEVTVKTGADVVVRTRRVAARWLEARAACIDPATVAFETEAAGTLAARARETAERRAQWDARQAERDAARAGELAAREAHAAAVAAQVAAAPSVPLPRADRDPAAVDAWIAPGTEAAMRAARLVELRLGSRCAAQGTPGYRRARGHCLGTEHVATLIYANGRTKERGSRDGWPIERMVPQVARIALDASTGRIRVEAPIDPAPVGPLRTGPDGRPTLRPERPGDRPPQRVAADVARLVEHVARWDGDGTRPWEAWASPPRLELPD